MKVKKAIKKIAALGMGATLVGATLLGASAANLNNYPDMFIKDGHFDGVIVVGANAKPIDNIGATNVALGLQSAAVSKTVVCTEEESTSTETVSVDDGAKLEKTNSYLNYGDAANAVVDKLTSSDLPNLLANGRYSVSKGSTRATEDYTQELSMTANVEFVFAQNRRDAPNADDYLKLTRSADAYNYVLQFDADVEFATGDHTDLEGSTLQIQGQTYTLSEVRATGATLDKMTFMVGDTLQWITQDETVSKTVDGKTYEISVTSVDNNGNKCGISVDGFVQWIDLNSQKTVNGLTVGVSDVIPVYSEDRKGVCQLNLGSSELVIEHGRDVMVDGSRISGSTGYLSFDGAAPAVNKWSGLKIDYQPRDDTFLAKGDEFVDPVLGNFKFLFGGIEATYEEMQFSVSGDKDGSVTFRNLENKEIVIPVYFDEGVSDNIFLADRSLDVDKLIYAHNGICDGTTNAVDSRQCEGATWILSQANGLAGLIEVERITDNTANEIVVELRDLTNGGSTKVTMDAATKTVNVPSFGNVDVTLNDAANIPTLVAYGNATRVQLSDSTGLVGGGNDIKTRNEGIVTIPSIIADVGGANLDFSLQENTKGLVGDTTVRVTFAENAGTDELEILAPVIPAGLLAFEYTDVRYSESNSDDRYYITGFGSKLLYDSKDKESLKVWHPERETRGIAYVAPDGAAASVSTGSGSNCHEIESINKIPSTVNKLDTQVPVATAQNVVTVGGPCVNSVSAALLGNPEDCTAGFEPGKSIIQLIENQGKVAMIVAGYSGEDTLLASQVLHSYKDHASKLTGSKVVLSGTSVSSVTAESVE